MEKLEKYFDTAFGASDGVKKFRELILTLAFQGKLTSPNSKHQTALDLIATIKSERKKSIISKNTKILSYSIVSDKIDAPYKLPTGWSWVQLREISHDMGQKRPNSQFTYIDVGSIDNKTGRISSSVQILDSKEAPSRARKIVKEGTIIYSTVRPYLLNIAIVEKLYKPEPIASTAFAILHAYPGINNRYVYYYLRSPVFINYVESLMKGVAYPAINDGDFFNGLIPLPPTIEQNEIVYKIDQFLSRCDELEKLHTECDQKRLAMHTAAIRKMLDAPDQETFDDAWQFITRHFSDLYAVRENVAELRKAILQLAVMGKLVKQDSREGTAKDLLEKIEKEKRKMVKARKIKELKPLAPIKPMEIPYVIPNSWEWVSLGVLIELISGQHLTPNEYNEKKEGFSYYTGPADFQETSPKPSRWTNINRAIALNGDILLTVKGAGVGKTNLLAEEKAAISRQLMAVRVICINSEYAHLFLKAIFYEFQAMAVGIAIPGIGREDVLQKCFPLPPLAEQNRIVQKTKNLMTFCGTIDSMIETLKNKKGEVLGAVMAELE